MGCRREERVSLRLRTVVRGFDRFGKAFHEQVRTLDYSNIGARLEGVSAELEAGSILSLVQGDRCAHFRVLWVGETGSPNEGQIGLQCVSVAHDKPKKVLFIEHQPYDRELRSGILRSGGYEVVSTSGAHAAWQELLSDRFDLLLLDHPVADADTTQVVRAVREYFPDTQILLATSSPGLVSEELQALANGLVHKGVGAAELVSRVADTIGNAAKLKWPIARCNPRYIIEVPVRLRVFRHGTAVTLQGLSTDISVNGLGVVIQDSLQAGELGTLFFRLPHSNVEFSPRVMVRRKDGPHFGLEFVELDKEQLSELNRLNEFAPPMTTPQEF